MQIFEGAAHSNYASSLWKLVKDLQLWRIRVVQHQDAGFCLCAALGSHEGCSDSAKQKSFSMASLILVGSKPGMNSSCVCCLVLGFAAQIC